MIFNVFLVDALLRGAKLFLIITRWNIIMNILDAIFKPGYSKDVLNIGFIL